MSLFCEKCSAIMRPIKKDDKKILACSCGFEKDPSGDSLTIKEEITNNKPIEAVKEATELMPKVRIKCDSTECENNIAFYWTQQTRAADEPETRFFKCTKCAHTWREYS